MKISKKVLIPVFATAMGLSVIGGISGAVAWYQYNTKVTASYVGTSVADTGTLQISNDGNTWHRDLVMDSTDLYPVTFGKITGNNAIGETGYMYPECGHAGYDEWATAEANTHYAQFDLYFRALQTNPEATSAAKGYVEAERDVYLSRWAVNLLDPSDDSVLTSSSKNVDDALRVQIAVIGTSPKQTILGKADGTDKLSGNLDLDGVDGDDTYVATPFDDIPAGHSAGEKIVYGGDASDTNTVVGFDTIKAERDASDGTINDAEKKLFSTTATATPVHIRITVWLEGWALLNNGTADSAIWNPYTTAGVKVQLGMEFDTGIFRGSDLSATTNA